MVMVIMTLKMRSPLPQPGAEPQVWTGREWPEVAPEEVHAKQLARAGDRW